MAVGRRLLFLLVVVGAWWVGPVPVVLFTSGVVTRLPVVRFEEGEAGVGLLARRGVR